MIENRDKALSRDRIMDLFKGQDWMPTNCTIDNQISRLRKGNEPDPKNPSYIKTIHGAGYKFTANRTNHINLLDFSRLEADLRY